MPLTGGLAGVSNALVQQELVFVLLLSIAAAVAIFSRRLRLPYTVALVLAGLGLTFIPGFLVVPIGSDLILALLVPPLVFEGTLTIPWAELRRDLALTLLLAVVGVVVGAVTVAVVVSRLLGLPMAAAFTFGALISATDPVAIIAFFRRLGVSKRLSMILEGESLLNDGTAIVLFGLSLGAVAANGAASPAVPPLVAGITQFLRVSMGGVAVGALLGYGVAQIVLARVDDHLIETATTVALAFGSYVVAESLHVSGLLAVVAAGILVGNVGPANTSPTTQLVLRNFWEFMAFVANSLVFLIIGLEIHVIDLVPAAGAIVAAVGAVLFSRAIVVYGLTGLHGLVSRRDRVSWAYRHVMFWGGLRGAIGLALALSLRAEAFGPGVDQTLRMMTFGVVLFTLLVQGTTVERLILRLGLAHRPQPELQRQRHQGWLIAQRAGRRRIEDLHRAGILSERVWRDLVTAYDRDIETESAALLGHLDAFPEMQAALVDEARVDARRAERAAVTVALNRGLISDAVHDEIIRAIDEDILARLAARATADDGAPDGA